MTTSSVTQGYPNHITLSLSLKLLVNSLIATTSRKQPPLVSDHFAELCRKRPSFKFQQIS